MDQLHEELKEPVVATAAALTEARDSDSSDTDEKREGDRSPSEDEFLSCDSSSDRGEGDGQGRSGGGSQAEAELLLADEAGRAISEKERMKEKGVETRTGGHPGDGVREELEGRGSRQLHQMLTGPATGGLRIHCWLEPSRGHGS